MHELVIAKYLLRQVLEVSQNHADAQVAAIYLQIGELRGVIDEWVQRYFTFASKGTAAEQAQVHIEHIPAQVVCRCGALTPLTPGHLDNVVCCACGNSTLRLYSGQEFTLVGITINASEDKNDGTHLNRSAP